MTPDAYSHERLAAREAIRDALFIYCRAIDRCAFHLLDKVFHAQGVMETGSYVGIYSGFVAVLNERHARIPRAAHSISNILFDFLDDDHAFVESYAYALEEFEPEPGEDAGLNRVVRIRYADDFSRQAGAWKIDRRRIIVDHAMAPQPSAPGGFFRGPAGTRNAEDPVLSYRVSLGIVD